LNHTSFLHFWLPLLLPLLSGEYFRMNVLLQTAGKVVKLGPHAKSVSFFQSGLHLIHPCLTFLLSLSFFLSLSSAPRQTAPFRQRVSGERGGVFLHSLPDESSFFPLLFAQNYTSPASALTTHHRSATRRPVHGRRRSLTTTPLKHTGTSHWSRGHVHPEALCETRIQTNAAPCQATVTHTTHQ